MDLQETTRATFRDFLHIVFKRKKIILLFFFATICTVALLTFLETPTYVASSQILVKIGREDVFTPEIPTGSNVLPSYFNRQEQLNSEIEILSGRALAERVIESIGAETIYGGMESSEGWGIKRIFERGKEQGSELEVRRPQNTLLNVWGKTLLPRSGIGIVVPSPDPTSDRND